VAVRGIGRLRATVQNPPTLDLSFLISDSLDSRITASGGANGTRVNSAGTIVAATTPRFDYNPTTLAAKGLLVEEARTNLLLYSGALDNGAWSNNGTTKAGASGTAPDGTNAATLVTADGASSTHYVAAADAAGAKAVSVFAKAGTQQFLQIATGGTTTPYANYELSGSGTATAFGAGTTAFIESFPSGWYRCVLVTTNALASGVRFVFITSAAAARFETNTLATTLYLWGAQAEAGAFATSYIPTTSATVARTADSLSMTGANFSDWFNASAGTFVVNADTRSTAANRFAFAASDATVNEEISHYVTTAANNLVTDGGVSQGNVTGGTITASTAWKNAFAYTANDLNAAIDGTLLTQDTSATIPTVDRLSIGRRVDDTAWLNGHVRTLRYYSTRLPDATLQTLTV
jgi:hypothetical protein